MCVRIVSIGAVTVSRNIWIARAAVSRIVWTAGATVSTTTSTARGTVSTGASIAGVSASTVVGTVAASVSTAAGIAAMAIVRIRNVPVPARCRRVASGAEFLSLQQQGLRRGMAAAFSCARQQVEQQQAGAAQDAAQSLPEGQWITFHQRFWHFTAESGLGWDRSYRNSDIVS